MFHDFSYNPIDSSSIQQNFTFGTEQYNIYLYNSYSRLEMWSAIYFMHFTLIRKTIFETK